MFFDKKDGNTVVIRDENVRARRTAILPLPGGGFTNPRDSRVFAQKRTGGKRESAKTTEKGRELVYKRTIHRWVLDVKRVERVTSGRPFNGVRPLKNLHGFKKYSRNIARSLDPGLRCFQSKYGLAAVRPTRRGRPATLKSSSRHRYRNAAVTASVSL